MMVKAQSAEDWSLFFFGKTHSFYNSGEYRVSNSSNATGPGFGFSIHKQLSNKIGVFGGYSLALADSLQYADKYASNSYFHQWNVNMAFHFRDVWKLRPYVFSGYTYNNIKQLKAFDLENKGMSVSLGIGTELELTEDLGFGYQFTYDFSLAENVPFNFKNKIGIVIYPSIFGKSKRIDDARIIEKARAQLLEAKLTEQRIKKDSFNTLLKLATQKIDTLEKKLELAQDNDDLIDKINFLEEDNQRLLLELREKQNINDSLF